MKTKIGVKNKSDFKENSSLSDSISQYHTDAYNEDIAEIIGKPPSVILRLGTFFVFVVLIILLILSSYIRYPELIQAPLKINAIDAPKAVIAKVSGNIVNILVEDGSMVVAGQDLAWMESTTNHREVLDLFEELKQLQYQLSQSGKDTIVDYPLNNLNLGELQSSYQLFYQAHLSYQACLGNGIFLKRKKFIHQEIRNLKQQREELGQQLKLQERQFSLAKSEFERSKIMIEQKVIAPAEYEKREAAFLANQYPLLQTHSAILNNHSSHIAKQRELTELAHQIDKEKSKFLQALNQLISEIELWKSRYILSATQSGKITFAGVIQKNQFINVEQIVFYVNSGSTDFFVEVEIPQHNMGKIEIGQDVLIKLNSYPFEEYGPLRGKLRELSKIPLKEDIFLSLVDIQFASMPKAFHLTTGMTGTAEIITKDASLLQRLTYNVTQVLNSRN